MSATARRLRNLEKFRETVRSFEWLGAAASGATDVDFLTERRGRFLVLEGKTWHNGLNVPLGQHIALSKLAQVDVFTVFLVGETDGETFFHMRYGRPHPLTTTNRGAYFPASLFTEANREDMRALVTAWKMAADLGAAFETPRSTPGGRP